MTCVLCGALLSLRFFYRSIHVVQISAVTHAESGVNVFAPYRPITFRLVALFVMLLGDFPNLSDSRMCAIIHNNKVLRWYRGKRIFCLLGCRTDNRPDTLSADRQGYKTFVKAYNRSAFFGIVHRGIHINITIGPHHFLGVKRDTCELV